MRLKCSQSIQRTSARVPRRIFTRLLATVSLAVLMGAPLAVSAQGGETSLERSVKAAFLYKFLGYTEFPGSAFGDAAGALVIGVVGADELADELARIVSGRTVQGRPVAVKVLPDARALAGVHLLFVGGSDDGRVAALLRLAQPVPVLVVTESEQGLQHGSVINFKLVEERVRFDVSLAAANRNRVKLSSRLLTVADHVIRGVP